MKLIDKETLAEIVLTDDLLWADELDWVPVVASKQFTLTGALLIEQGVKQFGRPLTLKSPDSELGWVTRDTVTALRAAAGILNRKFTLQLEYAADIRAFTVMFDHEANPVQAVPVLGFASPNGTDYFTITIILVEVQA